MLVVPVEDVVRRDEEDEEEEADPPEIKAFSNPADIFGGSIIEQDHFHHDIGLDLRVQLGNQPVEEPEIADPVKINSLFVRSSAAMMTFPSTTDSSPPSVG